MAKLMLANEGEEAHKLVVSVLKLLLRDDNSNNNNNNSEFYRSRLNKLSKGATLSVLFTLFMASLNNEIRQLFYCLPNEVGSNFIHSPLSSDQPVPVPTIERLIVILEPSSCNKFSHG